MFYVERSSSSENNPPGLQHAITKIRIPRPLNSSVPWRGAGVDPRASVVWGGRGKEVVSSLDATRTLSTEKTFLFVAFVSSVFMIFLVFKEVPFCPHT